MEVIFILKNVQFLIIIYLVTLGEALIVWFLARRLAQGEAVPGVLKSAGSVLCGRTVWTQALASPPESPDQLGFLCYKQQKLTPAYLNRKGMY